MTLGPATTSGRGEAAARAFLSSSDSLDKTAASQASMTMEGFGPCTGWLETSTDNGRAWQQDTPTYSMPLSAPAPTGPSPGPSPDPTGKLARACAQSSARSKACTAAW